MKRFTIYRKELVMTYQYALLAVGTLKRFRAADYAIPLDRNGNRLPADTEEDEWLMYGTKKVVRYDITNGVMYCYLDVGS